LKNNYNQTVEQGIKKTTLLSSTIIILIVVIWLHLLGHRNDKIL